MADTEPLPLDAYYDLTEVTGIALSPSENRVAFTTTESDPDADESVASLFVAPTDGSRPPHRLTRLAGASDPEWGPNGDRLAFLAAREEDTARRVGQDETDEEETSESEGEVDADEAPDSQVWLFDLSLGGDAKQVTDFDEGVREFDWAPDGTRLVVSAKDPTAAEETYLEERREGGPIELERTQHKLDGVGYLDPVTTYLHIVDIESGDVTRLDEAYGGGAYEGLSGLQPAWGPTDRIAFVSCRVDDPDDTLLTDIYTIDPDGGDLRKLTGSDLSANAPEWSPNGGTLAFAAGDPENWCVPTQVYLHRLDGDGSGLFQTETAREEPHDGPGTGTYESLTQELDRTLARGATIDWADAGTLYTLIADEARTRLLRIGTDGTTERVFEAQGTDRALAGFEYGDARSALLLSDPQDGKDVHAVDSSDLDATVPPESLTQLSRTNDSLIEDHPMPEVRRVRWESEGHEISGVVYHDPNLELEAGPHPLVVAIHGGPLSYDEPVFSFDHAALTSRGYVILRPNYRGGSSYGQAFAEELRGQWGTKEVVDIVAGVQDTIDRGWADPDRVFGYGFSYGGIAQGFLVTQEPELLTAAAPEHGIYDLRSAYGTDDSHVWMENEYGLPWENPETFDASSAITDAGNIETPLLITAGREDWRCPPSQSEQLYLAAKKQDVEARLVLYENEHHNIGDPDRAIHRFEEVLAWYERHDPAVDATAATDPHDRVTNDGE